MTPPAADPDLLPTPAAAELLDVPIQFFTEAADAVGFEAAVPGTKTSPRLWKPEEVAAFGAGPHGDEMRAAVTRDAEVAAEVAALATRFPDWKAAIRPAADALFQFNRFVKWATCTPMRRRDLYGLKGKLLKLLYAAGYCTAVVVQTAPRTEDDDAEEARDGPREFLAFAFLIDGRRFSWHAPREQITWPCKLTEPESPDPNRPAWQPNAGTKPVTLDAAEFVAAEALLRFVLAGEDADEAAEAARVKQERAARLKAEGLARQTAMRQQDES